METGWQDMAALGIVLTAAVYLIRSFAGSLHGSNKSGCGGGGCGRCPSQSNLRPGRMVAEAPADLITIDAIKLVKKPR